MDAFEIAEERKIRIAANRRKVLDAAEKYQYKKIYTDADMASVKVHIGGGNIYINGNGRDGRQTVFIAPNDAELPTVPVSVIFDAGEGSYICSCDYSNNVEQELKSGRYIVVDGGGLLVIKRIGE